MTILVITTKEFNAKTRREQIITSHGVDLETGRNVVLPTDHPSELGAVWSHEYGEYILEDKK